MNKHEVRSEETRTRILEAAERCFAQSGYDGTSVSQICQAAGVSKGALYHHYESKQDIFVELLNRWLEEMEFQLADLSESVIPVPERLLSMSAIIGSVLLIPQEQLLIYLEFVNRAVRNPKLWERTIGPYTYYHQQLTELVEAGVSEGSLRAVQPKTAARIIIALAMGLLLQGFLDPTGADWDQVTNEGFKMMIAGLAA